LDSETPSTIVLLETLGESDCGSNGPNPPVTEALEVPAGMVGYVAMVASLIEGRRVSEVEIVQRLVRAMRQHSMARRRRIDYVVAQLHKHGP
jgi:hypothetical protein